jgi:hypothetical protein
VWLFFARRLFSASVVELDPLLTGDSGNNSFGTGPVLRRPGIVGQVTFGLLRAPVTGAGLLGSLGFEVALALGPFAFPVSFLSFSPFTSQTLVALGLDLASTQVTRIGGRLWTRRLHRRLSDSAQGLRRGLNLPWSGIWPRGNGFRFR